MKPKGWNVVDSETDVFINGMGRPIRVRSSAAHEASRLEALSKAAGFFGEPFSQIGDWEVKPVFDKRKLFTVKITLSRLD